MIDPVIIRAVTIALGLVLVGAAWHKLSSRQKFAAIVADYQLLPQSTVPLVAWLIPVAEILLGMALLTGVATGPVSFLTALMFIIYSLAITANLLRGRLHISCGCGLGNSSGENQPLSWILVLRNVLLTALALLPLLPVSGRALAPFDWFTLIAALLASALLYFGGSQLFQNQSAIRSWRTPRA
jgi:uncharacterized membrane protein YphA (DoxX/SURF4 family)